MFRLLRRFLLLVIVLCLLASAMHIPGQAQVAGWPIVERCVSLPTEPPDGWTYDGVILATGWAGLHGIRADLDTPYVVAWFDPYDSYNTGSKLSPDGRWFALVEAEINDGPMFADWIEVSAIKVFSTTQQDVVYELPWEAMIGGRSDKRIVNSIYWLDDNHVIFQDSEGNDVRINPFTGAVQDLETTVKLPQFAEGFYPSPDWTRGLVREGHSTDDGEWKAYDLQTGETLNSFLGPYFGMGQWLHNSEAFVFLINEGGATDYSTTQMALFDKNSELIDVILSMESARKFAGFHESAHDISYDDRYFAFVASTDEAYPSSGQLLIADLQEHKVYDTCVIVSGRGLAWSPDAEQLVFSTSSTDVNPPLNILDLSIWRQYRIAYHSGNLLGWRAND